MGSEIGAELWVARGNGILSGFMGSDGRDYG